jgi:gluconate 2-dehydrogenase gamma chain
MSARKEHPHRNEFGGSSKELFSLLADVRTKTIDRRVFVTRLSVLLAAAAELPRPASAGSVADPNTEAPSKDEPWPTLSAVHDHLFPTTPDAPGAREINATAFLRTQLAEPHMDPDNRKFILNGVGWLNDIAVKRHEARFIVLGKDQREDVLRQIEKTGAGERWISLVLLYIFEALLSDPVYGGNPDQIGWKWLEHQPGFPRPPANQRYQKL